MEKVFWYLKNEGLSKRLAITQKQYTFKCLHKIPWAPSNLQIPSLYTPLQKLIITFGFNKGYTNQKTESVKRNYWI